MKTLVGSFALRKLIWIFSAVLSQKSLEYKEENVLCVLCGFAAQNTQQTLLHSYETGRKNHSGDLSN